MAGSAILSIKILTDASKAQAGLKNAEQSATGFGSKLAKGSAVAGVALAGVAAFALSAAKAAAEDEQAQAVLANTLRKSAGATDAQVASTEDWISATASATGVADDQLRPALANIVRATGDVTKSQDAMAVALDVSAATGQDVETVSKALAKGYAGNTKALGRLVPGMDKAVLAGGDMSAVMAELQRTTGGAAAAAANTAAGKWQRFQLALSETKEGAGAALLPVLSALAGLLVTVGNFAQKHSTSFMLIAGAIAAVAAAVVVLNVAMTVYTAVTTAAGIAAGTAWAAILGPILLIVAAVALVIGIIVLLWNKFPPFKAAVLAVWSAIRAAAVAVATTVRAVWMAIWPPISAALRVVGAVFSAVFRLVGAIARLTATVIGLVFRVAFAIVAAAARPVAGLISAAFNAVRPVILAVANALKGPLAAAFHAVGSAASAVGRIVSGAFNGLLGIINGITGAVNSLISALGRIHVPKISLPHIPGLSAAAPTAAGVGGGGFRAASLRATPAARSTATTGAVVINVTGAIDPESTARQIRRILDSHDRRMGLTGVLRTGTV